MSEVEVVFCHIPKSGGISIVKALEDHYGAEQVVSLQHHLHDPRALYWTNHEAYQAQCIAWRRTDEPIYETVCQCGNRNGVLPHRMGDGQLVWCSCGRQAIVEWKDMYPMDHCKAIWGHFPFQILDDCFNYKTAHITWIRDPVERIISLYYYWMAQPGGYDPYQDAIKAGKMSLLQFAETRENRESITGVYLGDMGDMIHRIPWAFDFDNFEQSWFNMFALLWGPDSVPALRHENKAKLIKYASLKDKREIAKMNPNDMGFWLDYKALKRTENEAHDWD